MNPTKIPLRFGRNGKFRILQLSDIQETLTPDPRTLPAIERILDAACPDLVILGGDNCDGHKLKGGDELRRYLEIFTAPMAKRSIPWAHVFGNHDHDLKMDHVEQTLIYESMPCSVSSHTKDVSGVTNFVLPILAKDSDTVAFAVWGLDTGNTVGTTGFPHAAEVLDLFHRPYNSDCWDFVKFDQLMWYWNTSVALEKEVGKSVPGIMFMHIAPWEFQMAVDNPEEAGTAGATDERMSLGAFNSGLFATVLQRGDIRAISCGHSHEDSFRADICGISVSLDACAGYNPYGHDHLRGGRLFVIDEVTGEIKTEMIHYEDLK